MSGWVGERHRALDDADDIRADPTGKPRGANPRRRDVMPGEGAVVVVPAEIQGWLGQFRVTAEPPVRTASLRAVVLDTPEQFVLGCRVRAVDAEPVPLSRQRGTGSRGGRAGQEGDESACHRDSRQKL